jgi:hypothetical protein
MECLAGEINILGGNLHDSVRAQTWAVTLLLLSSLRLSPTHKVAWLVEALRYKADGFSSIPYKVTGVFNF